MKNFTHSICYLICLGLITHPTSMYAQEPLNPDTKQVQIEESVKKPSLYQLFKAKFPSISLRFPVVTWNQAKNILQQKGACMLEYQKCSHRDLIAIGAAFGFALGYGISQQIIVRKILDASSHYTTPSIRFLLFALILYAYLKLPFNPISKRLSPGDMRLLSTNLRNIITADPITLTDEKLLDFESVLLELPLLSIPFVIIRLAEEAWTILTEMHYAIRFDPERSILSNIKNYLQMNTRCIWSVENCKSQMGTPQDRRVGLYYWLGFTAGMSIRILKNITWGRAEYKERIRQQKEQQKEYFEEKNKAQISVSDKVKNKIEHLSSKEGNKFEWYEIINVDKNARKSTINKAVKKLAIKYHPDKHFEEEVFTEVMQVINKAHDQSGAK
jgi:hypothetical protein